MRHILKIKSEPFYVIGFLNNCKGPGKEHLYSCGCGEPGCAGFFEPAKIDYGKHTIKWTIAEMYHGKKFEKPLIFEFNRDDYLGVGKKILKKLKEALVLSKKKNMGFEYAGYGVEPLLKRIGKID